MSYRLCRHVKNDGTVCQSPTLTDADFCCHHYRLRKRRRALSVMSAPATTAYKNEEERLKLTFAAVVDRRSFQAALAAVITAIAQDRIDHKRGSALLYGLQLTASNLSLNH